MLFRGYFTLFPTNGKAWPFVMTRTGYRFGNKDLAIVYCSSGNRGFTISSVSYKNVSDALFLLNKVYNSIYSMPGGTSQNRF
jgi:hypothetical protein